MELSIVYPYHTGEYARINTFKDSIESILYSWLAYKKKKIHLSFHIVLNGKKNIKLEQDIFTYLSQKLLHFKFQLYLVKKAGKIEAVNSILNKKDTHYLFVDNDIIVPKELFRVVHSFFFNTNYNIGCFSKKPIGYKTSQQKTLSAIFHPCSSKLLQNKKVFKKFRPTGAFYIFRKGTGLLFPSPCNEAEILTYRTDACDLNLFVSSETSDNIEEELKRRVNHLSNHKSLKKKLILKTIT